jgi:hypothetical protein
MPSKALLHLKWNTLPFVKIENGKITKTKLENTKVRVLVLKSQMKLPLNLFVVKSLVVVL